MAILTEVTVPVLDLSAEKAIDAALDIATVELALAADLASPTPSDDQRCPSMLDSIVPVDMSTVKTAFESADELRGFLGGIITAIAASKRIRL